MNEKLQDLKKRLDSETDKYEDGERYSASELIGVGYELIELIEEQQKEMEHLKNKNTFHQRKIHNIQEIFNGWTGLFIRPSYAMHQIGDVLKLQHQEVKDIQIINPETNEVIATAKTGEVVFSKPK